MTVAATTNRKTYTGDNVTTSFATSPVIFYLTSDLQVRTTVIATGVSTLLIENTHYTVSGGGAAGLVGTVNLAGGSSPHGALLSTEKLVILRVLPLTQASNFVNNNNSDAVVLMTALDKLTDVDQQLSERQDRALTFPEGDVSGSTTTLPAAATRAGTMLGFDALGVLTTLIVTAGTTLVNFASSTGSTLIGFLQAGAGAVLRSMQSKERDIVSVKDFGAVGDGVADDTAAWKLFASAVTASPGAFGLVPPGNYKISEAALGAYNSVMGSSIDFNGASNVTIFGYGATITVAATGAGGKVWLRFRSCTNVTIKGLSFVGYQTADGTSINSGVPLYFDTAASNITLEDLNGNSGWSIIEFQTDDLVAMGGVKYKNVTLRNIKTTNYHHAMELLHIDGLYTYGIRMSAIGTGNNINLRGIYALNVSNWNGDGIYSDGLGVPGTGGTAVFVREYTKGGSATLPNFNCDTINLSNIELVSCLQGGLEFNVASGAISNVNVSNLRIAADNTYSYGGGLLEFASDNAAPTGLSAFQFANTNITGSTKAANDGATGILFRDSSNVARTATIFTDFRFTNTQVAGNNSVPMLTGAGGWSQNLTFTNTKISTTLPAYITLNKVRDMLCQGFRLEGKIDFSLGNLVRIEFKDTYLGWTTVLNSTDMAPIIVNGLPLTTAVITVSGGGDDNNVGSVASPLLTNTEAAARLLKITNLISAPVQETTAARTVKLTDTDIAVNFAGTCTLTLIAPAQLPGRRLRVKTITANTVVSASANVENLIGSSVGTAILAATAGKWADLESDGTNWRIMAGN